MAGGNTAQAGTDQGVRYRAMAEQAACHLLRQQCHHQTGEQQHANDNRQEINHAARGLAQTLPQPFLDTHGLKTLSTPVHIPGTAMRYMRPVVR